MIALLKNTAFFVFVVCSVPLFAQVQPGAYQTQRYLPLLVDMKVAVVGNQSSQVLTNNKRIHLVDHLRSQGVNIIKVFAPEHGFRGKEDAGASISNEIDTKTGIPIVDAAMRQLNQTKWMHNRLRMITAMFLSKNLLIDWRKGEKYFASKLFDYEQASNVGNWQWVAGCGVDAAPYFRIFNPTEQLKKFDKQKNYVRKWVPEFESKSYANPIIDHKYARERCLNAYKIGLNK